MVFVKDFSQNFVPDFALIFAKVFSQDFAPLFPKVDKSGISHI
jgi:hypothetical protein